MLNSVTAVTNGATFGPFELDLGKRELRKHGIRLRLPDQSFEILAILAQHAGEVVTREEIRERLWPHGTIVEFEHSINAALKRLRDALGDSAAHPRFIETVARRGYVFIAPLDRAAPPGGSGQRFRLLEEAGRGAMGVVYRAEDLRLGRAVALKFLPEEWTGDRAALEQLRREARTAAALNHPNICTLHGIEEHEGRPCLVMEFLDGCPLSRLIEAGPLPLQQAIDFAIQACRALEAAHGVGVIHRDLKPANLFVTGSGHVKLTDFGIAVRSGETGSGQAGTPSYMSPEQLRGEAVDSRSDIFSLGLVLYEMITGRRARGRADAGNPAANLPGAVRKIIVRCLRENPADRFRSAAELRTALETLHAAPFRWRPLAAAAVLLAIAIAAIAWKAGIIAPKRRPSIRSIAVLPLLNLSGDPAQEYFADGMTEQLITELARMRGWDVISRTSVMRYKGTRQPLREIARELGVDAVVEGTATRSGGRVRITAQLIDAAADRHIWSDSFERDLTDVLELQAGIARTIAGQVGLTLTPSPQVRPRLPPNITPEAYDAYLQGWFFFNRAQYRKAASYFEQATLLDPNFALAHALLGESEGMVAFGQDSRPGQRALQSAERARQLDDTLSEGHALAGDALIENFQWEAGLAEYRRAVELDPGSIDASFHYVVGLHMLARWQLVEQELRRALRLDPVSPIVNLQMLRVLVDTHRYDRAQEQFRKLIELDPNNAAAWFEIAGAYSGLGRENDAVAAFLKSEALSGASAEAVAGLAASGGGWRGCVKTKITQLEPERNAGRISPHYLAGLYASMGDKEQALALLEAAWRERRPRMIWIKARATWDPLRSDPRFQSLLRRMKFPD